MINTKDLKQKIDDIKFSNERKLKSEISKSINDLKSNEIAISKPSKDGNIDLNIKTNRRSLLAFGSAALLLIGGGVVAYNKFIKKRNEQLLNKDKVSQTNPSSNKEQ